MEDEELRFESLKEDRGWYFVEYSPCQGDNWFAIVQVVMIEPSDDEHIAAAVESEAAGWMRRYSVPVMASAFDDTGDLHGLEDVRPSSSVIAYMPPDGGEPRLEWRESLWKEIPHSDLDNAALLRVFAGIPVERTSQAKREAQFRKEAKSIRTGRRLAILWLVMWIVAIPLAWALAQWAGPRWLGTVVFVYCIIKALLQFLRLVGVLKPFRREQERLENQERMEHYYEHCERNPEGFQRLELENLDQEAREQARQEAQGLRQPGG
jgi:hypothetical protein